MVQFGKREIIFLGRYTQQTRVSFGQFQRQDKNLVQRTQFGKFLEVHFSLTKVLSILKYRNNRRLYNSQFSF